MLHCIKTVILLPLLKKAIENNKQYIIHFSNMCNYFQSAGGVNLDTLRHFNSILSFIWGATEEESSFLSTPRRKSRPLWRQSGRLSSPIGCFSLSWVPGDDASGTGSWCRWSEVAQSSQVRHRAKSTQGQQMCSCAWVHILPGNATFFSHFLFFTCH